MTVPETGDLEYKHVKYVFNNRNDHFSGPQNISLTLIGFIAIQGYQRYRVIQSIKGLQDKSLKCFIVKEHSTKSVNSP